DELPVSAEPFQSFVEVPIDAGGLPRIVPTRGLEDRATVGDVPGGNGIPKVGILREPPTVRLRPVMVVALHKTPVRARPADGTRGPVRLSVKDRSRESREPSGQRDGVCVDPDQNLPPRVGRRVVSCLVVRTLARPF